MILILTNIVLMSLRWLLQKVRHERYANVMHKVLGQTGLFIERAASKAKFNITAMELLKSPTSSKGLKETLLEDSYLRIHQMDSMVEIDLTNWIAYKGKPNFLEEVRVLVEARISKLKDLETQVVFNSDKLHILSCGRPIAWRVEKPLGLVIACNLSDLVQLIDAFGQDSLMLSANGLEIIGLATVKTKGWPQHLISKEEDVISLSPEIQYHMQKEKDNFSSSIPRTMENNENPNQGKSEDISDGAKNGKSPPASQETEVVNTKPPNILVYCGVKDSARKFAEAKASLQSCVNTDAYIVYHLSHDNLISSPWQRNTAALVITSCEHLRSDAEEKIYSFVKNSKGKIISFNSSIDKRYSPQVKSSVLKSESDKRLLNFNFKTWSSVSSVSGPSVYRGLSDQAQVVIPLEIPAEGSTEEAHGSKHESDTSVPTNSDEAKSQTPPPECNNQDALVVKISSDDGGTVILSQLLLERDPSSFAIDDKTFTILKKSNTERLAVLKELLGLLGIDTNPGPVPKLTCCHMVAKIPGLKETFLDSFKSRLNSENVLKSRLMCLKFHASPDEEEDIQPNLLPITTNYDANQKMEFFDLQLYWANLKSRSLGQLVFYTEVITSTMPVFDGLLFSIPSEVGPVAIAGRQTSGRGRGGNAWLSPVGCAMFTVPMKFSLDSELGSSLSCLQHVVAVSVIQSVVTLPGYEAINIRLKWPNDIYFGREIKLGGVIVTSTLLGNDLYATIGCGFNVSNSNPTMCINDIIRQHNSSNPDLPPLQLLSPEQLVARIMTILEELVDDFQCRGSDNFFKLYYKYWLHGGTRVKVELDTKTEGEIVGLDKHGFLSVRTDGGKLISVQPDGNSFDMMHNLIHLKTN